jgi:transposase
MSTKHKLTTKKLQETISQIRKGNFPYKTKEPKKIDFTKYNTAQINEIADVLETIRDIVDKAYGRLQHTSIVQKGPGRPSISMKDVVKVQLMESYFGVSDRVSQGFLRLFREKLGIASDFSYKTIERGYDPERSEELLEEILKITNELGNSNEKKFSIDGTGDPCSMKVNYESKRSQQRREKESKTRNEASDLFPGKKRDFQYSVFSIGTTTKIIGGFATTDDHSYGELSFFKEVVEETIGNCPMFDTLCGDGIYASRVACALLEASAITPFFMPRSNVTFRSRGVPLWMSMLISLTENPQQWLEAYHDRSMSETGNSMLKRREPAKIRKRLSDRKGTQEALKFMVHNIRQICYLRYLAPKLLAHNIIED